jgi:hypothetical protein
MNEESKNNGCLAVLGRSILVAGIFGFFAMIPRFDFGDAWITFLVFFVIGLFTNGYSM